MLRLRNYQPGDFEALFKIDRQCFDPGIAYSRSELQSHIQRKHSFCIVAEASAASEEAKPNAPDQAPSNTPAAASQVGDPATASRNHKIAGFIVVELRPEGYGHIITIDVLPQYRRHHLGTRLIEAAEKRVRELDGFMMVLETAVNNTAALSFYERHKYKVLRKLPRYYANRIDALFLTKRL